jgi:hypothetical protein
MEIFQVCVQDGGGGTALYQEHGEVPEAAGYHDPEDLVVKRVVVWGSNDDNVPSIEIRMSDESGNESSRFYPMHMVLWWDCDEGEVPDRGADGMKD